MIAMLIGRRMNTMTLVRLKALTQLRLDSALTNSERVHGFNFFFLFFEFYLHMHRN